MDLEKSGNYFEYSAWSDKQTSVMIIINCTNLGRLLKYIYCAILREKDDCKGKSSLCFSVNNTILDNQSFGETTELLTTKTLKYKDTDITSNNVRF